MTSSRASNLWILGLSLVCLAGIVLTFTDYGITWDEDVQATYGELALDYYLSGLQDTSYRDYHDLRYYGALFEMVCAAISRLAGTDPFETRHFCIAITGLLTLIAIMLLARLWWDPWIPALAGIALVMLPRFYGHAFNNSKDIPFACCFAWAMLAIARMATVGPTLWRHAVVTGLAIGLALSLRMGGLLLIVFAGLAVAARVFAGGGFRSFLRARSDPGAALSAAGPALGKAVALVGTAWVVMVAGWPWAHENVILNPLEAFRVILDFEAVKEIRYAGEFVSSKLVPRSYVVRYLLITTPLSLLLLSFTGLIVVAKGQLRDPRGRDSRLGFVLQLWLFVPIVYFLIALPTVYDGIRHFLFVLPPMALLAGIGGAWIRRRAAGDYGRRVLTVAMLAMLLSPARDLITLHPYQSTYFNALVGGVGGAWERYDTDYWASSYKEAGEWISQRAEQTGGRPLRILLAGNSRALRCARHYLPPDAQIQLVNRRGLDGPLPPGVDYYVALTRRHFHTNFPDAPVLHTIGRNGGVYTVIKGPSEPGRRLPG